MSKLYRSYRSLLIPVISGICLLIMTLVACSGDGGGSGSKAPLAGSWRGQWEGYLLNELNSGSASMTVNSNGETVLSMGGRYGSAEHSGYIQGNTFIITSKSPTTRCSIINTSTGIRINLIWTGMNADVYLDRN